MNQRRKVIMDPQPGPSYLSKKEFRQARLSLIEYEEEPSQDESLVSSEENKETGQVQEIQTEDIIVPGYEPPIVPPPSSLPDEPWNPLWAIWNVCVYFFLTLTFFVLSPVLILVYIFVGAFPRYCVKGILNCVYGWKVKLLPVTRVFGSSKGNHHTVMLICRGRCDIEKIRDHMTAIIDATDPTSGEKKFAHLVQRVATYFGYLCLERRGSHRFDIKNHVKHFDIRSKNLTVDPEDVIPYLESTYQDPFENSLTQPQWEILVIPKYAHRKTDRDLITETEQQKRLYALIFRFHHGIMDWNMFQQLLVEFIGKTRGRVRSIFCPPVSKRSSSRWEKFLIYLAVPFVGPYSFMMKAFKKWNRFAGMKKQCPEKLSFSMTKPINSETIEDIKDRTYVCNDTVLASCARIALRNMVLGQNVKIPKGLSATRIFNTTSMTLPGIDYFTANYRKYRCCLERLHGSFHAMGKSRIFNAAVKIFNKGAILYAGIFNEKITAWIYKTVMKSDIIIEIWPGTDEPCKVFSTDVVADIFGWSGVTGTDTEFKITVTSYCGRLRANVTGRLGHLGSDQTDARAIAQEFEEEYKLLAATAGVYPYRLFLAPTVDD